MSDLTVQEQQDVITVNNILDNSLVLSNILELATSVIIKISGKDISSTINKESLNRSVLSNLVANRLKEKILD